MDAIYKLNDGRYIDLDKLISISPVTWHNSNFGKMNEKFFLTFQFYGNSGTHFEEVRGNEIYRGQIAVDWNSYKENSR